MYMINNKFMPCSLTYLVIDMYEKVRYNVDHFEVETPYRLKEFLKNYLTYCSAHICGH